MQRRLLVVFGLGGALIGLVVLLVLLFGRQPPRPEFEVTDQPPAAITAPPPDDLRAVPESGTLRGKVINGKTGDPIPDARVEALTPKLDQDTDEEVPDWGKLFVRAHVVTDARGSFRLADLPKDYWNLWVEKRGYAWTTVPRAKFAADHVIKLWPACSVRGRVVYPDDTPASGVRLEYHVQGTHSEVFSHHPRGLRAHYAVTQADGTFEYTDLPPGKFTIEVYPSDHLPAPWKYEPPLKPSENRDLGTHKLDGGFGMRVRVLWAGTKEGVPGVEVVVRPVGDPMPRTRLGKRRRTDARGLATFQGLGGQVMDRPKFLVAVNVPGVGPVLPDKGGMHDPNSDVTVYLRKEGVVTGTVLRPNGNPLEHFGAVLRPVGHFARQLQTFGKNGKFKLFSVPEGKYVLHVRFGNYIDAAVDVEAVGGQEIDVGSITLQEGAEVYGTVTRSNGADLEGLVKVNLGRRVKNRAGHMVWEIVGRAYAKADGTYRIKGLPVGDFHIQPESSKFLSKTTEPVPIAIARGVGAVQKDLVLYGQGHVKLVFMDQIEGTLRHVVPPPTYLREKTTGKEVRWLTEGTALKAGHYDIYVELPDAQGVSQRYRVKDVRVQEGETTDPIEVRLYEIRHGG